MRWLSCDCHTGQVIGELPTLSVETVGESMGAAWGSTEGTLLLPAVVQPQIGLAADGFGDGGFGDTAFGGASSTPAVDIDWRSLIAPWARYLVAVEDDGTVIWGGWTVSAPVTQDWKVSVSLVSWTAYLDRRFTGDQAYTQAEQCGLIKSLWQNKKSAPGLVEPLVEFEVTAGSTLRDRSYSDIGDKTLLSAMQALSGCIGGPEWAVRWDHRTGPERYVPVVMVADRLGATVPAGMSPATQLEYPGNIISFEVTNDWSNGLGANVVLAVSSADGDTRPQSDPQIFLDPDRPPLEFRWTPSTSITQVSTLNSHAKAALAVLRDGQTAWSLVAEDESTAVFSIGDTLGATIRHPALCVRDVSWPGDLHDPRAWVPVTTTGRAIGWERSLTGVRTVTPILDVTDRVETETDEDEG